MGHIMNLCCTSVGRHILGSQGTLFDGAWSISGEWNETASPGALGLAGKMVSMEETGEKP